MGSIDKRDNTPQLLNRLRMRQIALILAVQEFGTLRAAAAALGLTQPAATKMLHELESALGQSLFERVGRGLRLNAAGGRVTAYFQSIRGSMEALNRELGELRQGSAGRFAVGSIMAASPGRLTEALVGLKEKHPLLAIDIAVDTSDRLMAQLRDGVLEVVVGRLVPQPGIECDFRAIEDEALAIVVGPHHPLADKRRLAFGEMAGYPWVLQPPGSPMRELVEREFRDHGLLLPGGLVETGSILTTINLVRRSHMIGVIPSSVAQPDAQLGVLRVLGYRFQHTLEAYGSLVPKGRPLSQAAAEFLALLHGAPAHSRR